VSIALRSGAFSLDPHAPAASGAGLHGSVQSRAIRPSVIRNEWTMLSTSHSVFSAVTVAA
jgi:hypothetical protein